MFFLSDAVLSPRGLYVHIVYSCLFHFSQYDGCYLMDDVEDWQHIIPHLVWWGCLFQKYLGIVGLGQILICNVHT